MKKCALLFLIFSLGIKAEIVTMSTLNWPPFFAESLPGGGFLTDLTREVLKTQGHTLKVNFIPWSRALKKTKRGDYDALLGCWYTKKREKYFFFSNTTVNSGAHFLAPSKDKKTIKKIDDLDGLIVGIIRGYATSDKLKESFLKKKAKNFITDSHTSLVRLLTKKKVDLIMENFSVMKWKYKKLFPSKKFDLKIAGLDFSEGHLHICWAKNKPRAKIRFHEFNSALQKVIKEGRFKKLWEKHNM